MRPSRANTVALVQALESAPPDEYAAVMAGLRDTYPEHAMAIEVVDRLMTTLRGGLPITAQVQSPEPSKEVS